jgi:molecular chaperone GrpE
MVKGKKIDIETDALAQPDGSSPDEAQPGAAEQGATDADAGDASGGDADQPETADLETRLAAAEQDARDNYDRYVRVAAEFDNYRKRSSRELAEFKKFATEKLVRELLPVIDNLERALASAEGPGGEEKGLKEGVALTLREILRVLDKFGVKPIHSLNEPFDPAFHQAMMQEEREGVPENTVISEMQKGYTMQDRLLRPAMVVVSAPGSSEDESSAGEAG